MTKWFKNKWKVFWCVHKYRGASCKNIYLTGKKRVAICELCGDVKSGEVL